jgi:hypothetical protein
MNRLVKFAVGMAIPALIMAGGMASSAVAQDKAAKGAATDVSDKVLLDNAKVLVRLRTFKPGVEAKNPNTSTRIIRVLKGGTLERTYADGKKEAKTRKAGEVYMNEPGQAFTNKNIGKTDVQLYIVQLK